MGKTEAQENRRSEREGSDVKRGGKGHPESVREIEKVGGHTGVRFPVHDHPDLSNVRSPERK